MRTLFTDILLSVVAVALLAAAFHITHDTTETLVKVMIGFAYTIVFFILIEHIPNRMKQKKYAKLIEKELRSLLSVLDHIQENLDLTRENVAKRCDQMLQRTPEKVSLPILTRENDKNNKKVLVHYDSIGEYLSEAQKRMNQIKRRLEKFTFFVESSLLDIIIDVEEFNMSSVNNFLAQKTKKITTNDIIHDFNNILSLQERIRKYLQTTK